MIDKEKERGITKSMKKAPDKRTSSSNRTPTQPSNNWTSWITLAHKYGNQWTDFIDRYGQFAGFY